eukprot:5040746-Ditylum_brightwellii.AAC.1
MTGTIQSVEEEEVENNTKEEDEELWFDAESDSDEKNEKNNKKCYRIPVIASIPFSSVIFAFG